MKPKSIVIENKDRFFEALAILQEEITKACDMAEDKYIIAGATNSETKDEYYVELDNRQPNKFIIEIGLVNIKPYEIKEIVLDKQSPTERRYNTNAR